MQIIADLHLHSKYSRATSPNMNARYLSDAAKVKGLNLLGTGDFTHPVHLNDLKRDLKQEENGIYSFNGCNFILSSEISLIYTQGGKGRRVHVVTLAPSFEIVDQINELLSSWGRRDYDGRPIFGKSCIEYADELSKISKECMLIPAHCFLPGTDVSLGYFSKPIESLDKGEKVLTHKGRFKKVTEVMSRSYNGVIYNIIPWYSTEGTNCTPEHPFFAIKSIKKCPWTKGTCRPTCSDVKECKSRPFEKYSPSWIKATDLEEGDILLTPRFSEIKDVDCINPSDYEKNSKLSKFNASEDFWRFIGYYLAEGYCVKGSRIGFAFHKDEIEYANDVKDICFKIFGLKPVIIHPERENIEFAFCSKELDLFMRKFCYALEIKNAFSKALPKFVISLPLNKQAELLRGWWRGDKGYTISLYLKEQMKTICLRLGIIPSIRFETPEDHLRRGNHVTKGRVIKSNHSTYSFSNLSFFEDNFNLLKDPAFAKFNTKRKTRHGWMDERYAYLPIRKMCKKKYEGLVFNLEVEVDHSYVINVGAVHNCWTPYFGVLGSKSGFDSIEECFAEKSKYITAIETGLSSDPAMNWRISSLDKYSLVSNSDSHSPYPWRLGREANIFEMEKPNYFVMKKALEEKDSSIFTSTIEVDPGYGKYHYDGHAACKVSFSPAETAKLKGICPVCGKSLTIGVENRVEELADRPAGFVLKGAPSFHKLIPLHEIIAGVIGMSVTSKKIAPIADMLITSFGSELNVLLKAPEKALTELSNANLASAIMKSRRGEISVKPGYDGEYGVPIFDTITEKQPLSQKTIFDY